MNRRSARRDWEELNREIIECSRCDRLRQHCRQVAKEKRRAYLDFDYWGRPVENFGDERASLLIVGLAPGAHGANRTGRMFTGDRSGDWLFRALHKAGFANQRESHDRDDGLVLQDCAITAACHCAPPANRPTADELSNCTHWYTRTLEAVRPRILLAMGGIAWNFVFRHAKQQQVWQGRRPQFAHGQQALLQDGCRVVASYHPSQQNTFTRRLTEPMLDDVFRAIRRRLREPDTLERDR